MTNTTNSKTAKTLSPSLRAHLEAISAGRNEWLTRASAPVLRKLAQRGLVKFDKSNRRVLTEEGQRELQRTRDFEALVCAGRAVRPGRKPRSDA